jgi:hypothetical protein
MHWITDPAEVAEEGVLSSYPMRMEGERTVKTAFFSYQIGSNRIKSAHPNHPRGIGIKSAHSAGFEVGVSYGREFNGRECELSARGSLPSADLLA